MRLIRVERFKFGAIRRWYSEKRGCEIDVVSSWIGPGAVVIRIRPRCPSPATRQRRTALRQQREAIGTRAAVLPLRFSK
jgi:hypothetical protein